jgi:hypothetical protein
VSAQARPARPALRIYDQFLDDHQIVRLHHALRALPEVGHGLFWLDANAVRAYAAGDVARAAPLAEYFGDLAPQLFEYFARLLAVQPGDEACALEFWTRVTEHPTEHVYLHIDTHSGAKPEGSHPTPAWGTILHVGPGAGITGGGTTFAMDDPVAPEVLQHNGRTLPADMAMSLSREWMTVERRQNRLVVFDGRLPHFAAPVHTIDPQQPRVALLVNLWPSVPSFGADAPGCCRLSPREFKSFAKMSSAEVAVLARLLRRLDDSEIAVLIAAFDRLRRQAQAA